VFGQLWALKDSALDNTVSTAKNSPSTDSTEPDSSGKTCTPSFELGEPAEPLNGGDFLALQEIIALDGATCHPTYVEERHGKNTSTNRNGFHRMRQWHDRQNYVYGKEIDKQLLAEYENSTTALLSLRVERAVLNRVSLLLELSVALELTLDALRYRLDKHTDRWEWLLVLAGTRQYATPHAHIYV